MAKLHTNVFLSFILALCFLRTHSEKYKKIKDIDLSVNLQVSKNCICG